MRAPSYILVIRFKAFLVLLVSMEVFEAISVYFVLLVKELVDSLIMLHSWLVCEKEELMLLLVHSSNRYDSSWED